MFKFIFPTLLLFASILNSNNIVVHSENKREEIESYIKQFPFEKYQVVSTAQPGFFYLDSIDDLIKNILRGNRVWDSHIRNEILRYAKPGTTVVDVGAYIGAFTINMVQAVGPNGKVIAIEPQPKIFRELVMNMSLNQASNVEFHWVAVGNKIGQIELSPFTPGNQAGTGLWGGTGEFVDLITLDSLNLQNVSLIKIDVEGMDDEVLDGAKETIMRNRPVILMEIMGGHSYDTALPAVRRKIEGTIERLHKLGYNVRNLWHHDYLALPQ